MDDDPAIEAQLLAYELAQSFGVKDENDLDTRRGFTTGYMMNGRASETTGFY